MARTKGTFNISANIETNASAPLDARERVATLADLTASGSFPYFYEGMQVYVVSEHKRYTLKGNDPTVSANWEENGSGGGGSDIQVDTLPTASADELGNIYQYVGTTTADYTNGFFYECVSDGEATPTYSWELKNVDDDEVVEISKAEFDALLQSEKDNGKAYFIPDTDIMSNLTVAGFTPVGTVISVMGNTAPRHYLKCEGQVVNISDYPELATYFYDQFGSKNHFGGDGITTFGIPDLRGEFLRGTGTNSHANQGNGEAVGVHQHASGFPAFYVNSNTLGIPVVQGQDFAPAGAYGDKTLIRDGSGNITPQGSKTIERLNITGTRASTTVTGNIFTVRPSNTSILFCIATKNIYMSAENSYSTDEQVVGTWIDGKPLYQRTIAVTVPTTTADYTTVTSDNIRIANNASLKCYDGYYIYIDGASRNNICMFDRYYALPSDTRVMYTMLLSGGNEDMFRIRNNRTAANGLQGYVTCKYTKTTD